MPWPARTPAPPALRFTAYNYRFVLPNAGRHYDLSELDVKSEEPGSGGCCNCAVSARRRFVLDGQPVVADGGPDGGFVLRR